MTELMESLELCDECQACLDVCPTYEATQNIAGDLIYTDGVQTVCKVVAPFYGDITWTGTTAGTYYRYDTGYQLMDGDTITFELDIQDANGTHYHDTLTKTVE